jgi:hypothetical protein
LSNRITYDPSGGDHLTQVVCDTLLGGPRICDMALINRAPETQYRKLVFVEP